MNHLQEISQQFKETTQEKPDDDSNKELSLQGCTCTKNIGHKNFIPIKDFSLHHLPKDMEGKEYVFEMVKLYAGLTIRIHTEMRSPNRPPAEYQSQKNSEEDEDAESNHSGTGYVFSIHSEYTEFSKKRCRCKKCRESPENASTKWWLLTVYTAKHVLFDDSEAEKARCRLFFDEEPATGSQVSEQGVYIDGYKVIHGDDKEDRCRFVCATCDSALVERLKSIWKKFSDLYKYIPKQYQKGKDEGKPCFIVSHPHRRSKHITIGKVLRKEGGKYIYDNDTCSGSSGAAVYIVGKGFYYFNYVHTKTNKESGRAVGVSSCGYNWEQVSLKTLHHLQKIVYRSTNGNCVCQRLRKRKLPVEVELRNVVPNDTDAQDRVLEARESEAGPTDNAGEVSSSEEQRNTDPGETASSPGTKELRSKNILDCYIEFFYKIFSCKINEIFVSF